MTQGTIIERTGIPTEAQARNLAITQENLGWRCEVIKESDGTFTLIAYPPGHGSTEPAMNVGGPGLDSIDDGGPTTALSAGLRGLLDFIAKYESGGNYNAYFRHATNQNSPKFTSMKLNSVLKWQRNHTEVNGAYSSAVGRYQIIRKTLVGLVASMNLDGDSVRFSKDTQEKLAIKLLEQRGLGKFRNGSLSLDDFGNRIAMEWASMPVLKAISGPDGQTVLPGFSYYGYDGVNKAHASTAGLTNALNGL